MKIPAYIKFQNLVGKYTYKINKPITSYSKTQDEYIDESKIKIPAEWQNLKEQFKSMLKIVFLYKSQSKRAMFKKIKPLVEVISRRYLDYFIDFYIL